MAIKKKSASKTRNPSRTRNAGKNRKSVYNNPKKWAVLVYMAADVQSDQMRTAAKLNLQQMANVGSSPQVFVAAQIDLTGDPTRRYIFPPCPSGQANVRDGQKDEFPNINSASKDEIGKFVQWATSQCSPDYTLMIFWGHGFGLDDFSTTLLPSVPGFAFPSLMNSPKALPQVTRQTTTNLSALLIDETSCAGLKNEDLAAALKASLPKGQKVSILGLDCCEMAMAEVWGAMGECAELCVGSQSGEPYSSWPYNQILSALNADPTMTPGDVSKMIVDKFAEYYEGLSSKPSVTISVSDLGELDDPFLSSVNTLATELTSASSDPNSRDKIFAARKLCPIYDDDGYIDLDCFCAFLEMDPPNNTVSQACKVVRIALKRLVTYYRFAPYESDQMISLSKGLSVWFPNWIENPSFNYAQKPLSIQYLSNGYDQTNFAQKTGWDQFLKSM